MSTTIIEDQQPEPAETAPVLNLAERVGHLTEAYRQAQDEIAKANSNQAEILSSIQALRAEMEAIRNVTISNAIVTETIADDVADLEAQEVAETEEIVIAPPVTPPQEGEKQEQKPHRSAMHRLIYGDP